MWYMLTALEGAVNPEWAATPDLTGTGVKGRVGDTVCAFQPSAVIGDPIGTFLVVISVAPWKGGREREGRGGEEG